MRKIFLLFFCYFLLFIQVSANDNLNIISREEWWANEEYIYIDSDEWKEILESQKNTNWWELTDSQIKAIEKRKNINNILTTEYSDDNEISWSISTLNWRSLAWPADQSSKIRWLVIHHTHSEYENSIEWIRQIYKYHAISRQWGDIWYNYIIWYDWEIFEWRVWWELSVWAHDLWNNRQTLWISVMWDYHEKEISKKQYESLLKLSTYLVKKYDIDLSKKTTFHRECLWIDCDSPLISEKFYPIIGHRDAWHTSCPWDELYEEIEKIIDIISKKTLSVSDLYKKKLFDKFDKIGEKDMIKTIASLENYLEKKSSKKWLQLKWFILDYFSNKSLKSTSERTDKYIKIKLSYPDKKEISIKQWNEIYKIKRYWDSIRINNKIDKLFNLKSEADWYIEIDSWDRIPTWDKNKIYNDNKFRWEIVIYAKNNELIIVNKLKIEDYLKWLWEVWNSEHPEKIKSIIIAARTYALWYTTKEEKFPWEWYNWSDNPGVFQKYLWYWLEQRTPKVAEIVDLTKWQILTYDSKIIKPWYFSSSNWKTLSFYDYCIKKYSNKICSESSKKYPYLKSVKDNWWIWKEVRWHWVWMPWTWVSYYANKWWNAELILKYFYPWVEIK